MRTRIDLALCNHAFLPYVASLSILRDTGLPGHCPSLLKVNFPEYVDHKFVYRTPHAFKDLSPPTLDQCCRFDALHWPEHLRTSIREALQDGDIDAAFNLWTKHAERFCASVASSEHINVTRKHFGRGQEPKVVQTPVQAPPATREHGAADNRLASMLKLERKFSQLCTKLRSHVSAGTSAHEQFLNLCANVQQTWNRLYPNEPIDFVSAMPDAREVGALQDSFGKRLISYQQSLRDHRIDQHKSRLIQDWDGNRRLTYAWVRDAEPYVTPCFQGDQKEHEFVTKHAELHEMMLKEWSPIFNRYLERPAPQYSDFIESFPDCLPPSRDHTAENPFVLPPVSCETVADTIRALRPSAPGADGWNARELQALSPVAIDLWTEIYHAIEALEKWPTVLCEVPIATLRKGEGCTPLDVRPISLTPILYRVRAHTRFLQLQAWHMQWLPFQLKGGVPGKESTDAYFGVALDAEFCASSKGPSLAFSMTTANVSTMFLGPLNEAYFATSACPKRS